VTKSKPDRPLLLVNISQLITLRSESGNRGPRRGHKLTELGIIENGAVLCVGGKIGMVGRSSDVLQDPWLKENRKKVIEIDCHRQVVLPGFVDSHTHPVFLSPRLSDFEKRISGATYEAIASSGGGIRSSLEEVRKADKYRLVEKILMRLQEMADQGTTTVEAKSGYGLTAESELKSLEAIQEAGERWPGTVVSTLLGAHVVPKEFDGRRQEYIRIICEEMIPQASARKLAQFVDVFTERGAFTSDETEKIFEAALRHGLGVKAHAGQLTETALRPLLRFHPASLDHLDHVNEADIAELAGRDTIATLLPGTNYFLGMRDFPPARKLIDGGVAVALATDYNPGSSPTPSMPFVMSLACTHMKMSPAESITASTINAACALRLQERKGSIEPGKDADVAVFDAADYREIAYWFASDRCAFTVAGGNVEELE
jgi:imidazolonepropionase